jgi:hypothetical protein
MRFGGWSSIRCQQLRHNALRPRSGESLDMSWSLDNPEERIESASVFG